MRVTQAHRARLPELFHATKYVHLESILKRGLLPGGLRSARRHVHMIPYFPEMPAGYGRPLTRGGGRRSDADVVIQLAPDALMSEGRVCWLTVSGAVVTWNRIPWSVILKVTVGYGLEVRTVWDAAFLRRTPIPYQPPNLGGLARAAAGGAGSAAPGGAATGAASGRRG